MRPLHTLPIEPMELPYRRLDGLSERLLSEHYGIYLGYIERLAEVRSEIEVTGARSERLLGLLFTEEGFLRNAIRLHELCFENMTPGGQGSFAMLESDWRGWEGQFRRLALTAHGWVVLAMDLADGSLFNFVMKEHGQGYVAGTWPLLVMDLYEHAYMLQYGTNKKGYIDAFFRNIDWTVVTVRAAEAQAFAEAV
jgi:Fe-Mn family superoxide dismutase